MNRLLLIALVLLGVTGVAKTSYAEFITAKMLATLCTSNSLPKQYQKFAKDSCNGTIRAYLEYDSGMKTHFKLKVPFCLSRGGSSLAGATSTFIGYLQQNPHHKKNPAAIVFAKTVASVSKCK
jgi:hypothetical protein